MTISRKKTLPTVKICADNLSGYKIINQSDFNPDIHKVFVATEYFDQAESESKPESESEPESNEQSGRRTRSSRKSKAIVAIDSL